MGMFGPTNDEFDLFRSQIDDFKKNVDVRLREISSELEHSATDSELEAKGAAERARHFEESARSDSEKIIKALSEISAFRTSLLENIENLKDKVNKSENSEVELREKIQNVSSIHSGFLEEKKSLDISIKDLSLKIESVNEYLGRSEKLPGAVIEAEKLVEELNSSGESAKNILGNVVSRKNDIDKLHKEIYGEDINDADGKATHVDGIKDKLESAYENIQNNIEDLGVDADKAVEGVVLKHEILLSERKENYENLIKEARARYEQINSQITGLLPGAMAEGLSAAYEKKKEAEEISLLRFEDKFSYAIYGLVAISMIPFAVDLYLLAIKGRDLVQVVKETPSLIVAILPIYFPVLWLAYSMGKKANLSKRLIEEYTHKSVLGKTFSGLSYQIETLQHQGAVKEELRTKLLFNVLQVSAENPGKLITDYQKSDHPLMDALEKSGKLSDSLDVLSRIPGLSVLMKKIAEKDAIELNLQAKRVESGLVASEDISAKESQVV